MDAGGKLPLFNTPLHVTKSRINWGVIAILATDDANFATLLDTGWGLGHKWEKVVKSSKKWEIVKKLFTKSLSRSLDPKGRLMLPPEYRDGLIADGGSGSFWLTAFYGRLVAYLPADWDLVTEQLSSIPMPSPRLSHFKTKVMGLAQELEPDAQGRVRIPQVLMHEAKLHKDVMLVGMLNKFEIWDQASFNGLQLEDVSEELTGLGINLSL